MSVMALMPKAKAVQVIEILSQTYPDAKCALNFTTPFELLVATMLSAQCTDARVNMVTERLFTKYRGPEDYAAVTPEILQEDIKELGLFRTKSENIIATSKILLEKYHGEVPGSQDELVTLPGVGRKTANVVVSNAFDVPAVAVDTHVTRVSNRLGMADSSNPLEIEKQICSRLPKSIWTQAHHLLIHHGRQICHARKPECEICPVRSYCKYYKTVYLPSKKGSKEGK
jgi:endonuclease III